MFVPEAKEGIYLVGCGPREQPEVAPALVGGKAAGLIRMAAEGLPVPPAFVLPTPFCREYLRAGGRLPEGLAALLAQGTAQVEKQTGLVFGGERRPLLVSVRSGAVVSMPGMMDTLLNVGLSDRTLPALMRMTGNPRHAWDSYRRLVQAYGEVVCGLPAEPFARLEEELLAREGVPAIRELDVAALQELTRGYLSLFEAGTHRPFPQDPRDQLTGAIEAVFRSWESPRARAYRRLSTGLIPEELAGTAVTIQAMVFGNMGGTSGSGVAFSRDPTTGEPALYLDFLWNAQGEDVVAGRCAVGDAHSLRRRMPTLYRQLEEMSRRLEHLFGDVQDFELTVQEGRLYLLQSRDARRTSWAALRIACDLVREGILEPREALDRLASLDLETIRWVRLVTGGRLPLATGIPASAGAAVGEMVLDPERAVRLAELGRGCILVRPDMATSDVAGLAAAQGILTARGGRTSHAAVVARQMNRVCIVGCRQLTFPPGGRACRIGDRLLHEGARLSLEGDTGKVFEGLLEVREERPVQYLQEVRAWRAGM